MIGLAAWGRNKMPLRSKSLEMVDEPKIALLLMRARALSTQRSALSPESVSQGKQKPVKHGGTEVAEEVELLI